MVPSAWAALLVLLTDDGSKVAGTDDLDLAVLALVDLVLHGDSFRKPQPLV